jgi:RNA polymerase sigma-70 factor (ECF subfamily)
VTITERALVRRLLAGEGSAFDEFFGEYFPRLFRFASARAGGNDDLAEEAVQTALIRAIRKLDTFGGDAPLFTWVCAICHHELTRLHQRAGTHVEISLLEDWPDSRRVLDTMEREELARLVRSILEQLPPVYSHALEWKYIDRLSVRQIADRLGVRSKAAESLLAHAREAFRAGFRAAAPEGL